MRIGRATRTAFFGRVEWTAALRMDSAGSHLLRKLAPECVFFASPADSGFISGEVPTIHGGDTPRVDLISA